MLFLTKNSTRKHIKKYESRMLSCINTDTAKVEKFQGY